VVVLSVLWRRRRRRRRQRNARMKMAMRTTAPPTAPPAMAPMLVVLPGLVGAGDVVGGVDAEDVGTERVAERETAR
jgi:hypothetical protein